MRYLLCCPSALRHLTPAVLLAGALLAPASFADTASITLTDGSTLRGEVVSLKGGAYEIKTRSLGVVRIPQNDVELVSYANPATAASTAPATAAPAAGDATAAIAMMQRQLAANPENLSLIMGLSKDADVQAIISDPGIQAAISAGDLASLMQNPKIQRLMNHPTVQKITAGAK